jgi:hypothetical protein
MLNGGSDEKMLKNGRELPPFGVISGGGYVLARRYRVDIALRAQ